MNIMSSIVVFLVLWFLCLLVALPIGLKTQADVGEVVPGTPSSAPAEAMLGRKIAIVTVISVLLWALIYWIVAHSGLSIRDIDVWGRM